MTPAFCPSNGQLDLSRLRLEFDDDFASDPAIVTAVKAGIKLWEGKLGVQIVHLLDPNRIDDSSDYVIKVGKGKHAVEPNKTLTIPYAGADGAYLFGAGAGNQVIHEFGHMLGLADRYYEGYQHDGDTVGDRTSVPMDPSLFPSESGYDENTNIMAGGGRGGGPWTLSSAQLQAINACVEETPMPRNVVGIFDDHDPNWKAPATMALIGGVLYGFAPDGSSVNVGGYKMQSADTVSARGAAGVLKSTTLKEVNKVWCARKKTLLGHIVSKFHKGHGLHDLNLVSHPGEHIHRKKMSEIAKLAGS